MGETDYGLNSTDTPTNYSTSIFLGRIFLDNLATLNASLPLPRIVSFQLNVNLQFIRNGTTYVYWVQNILEFNDQSGVAEFLDNVWNASGYNTHMANSSIVGYGSVINSTKGLYYYNPAGSLIGNSATIELPAEIDLQSISEVVDGVPTVELEFQDGFGWEHYDTFSFPFAAGAKDSGFVVSGYTFRPDGAYYDAELVAGGPQYGELTKVDAATVNEELLYWNGHNFQEIENAYDFGSDTVETVSNVAESAAFNTQNGTWFASLRANGSGTLGPLYDRGDVAIVNISTSVPAGALYINGTLYGSFQGGQANLTLAPGRYTFTLVDNGLLEGGVTTSVVAGSYDPLQIAWHDVYTVNFTASGLPPGTTWSVTVNTSTQDSQLDEIGYLVSNGRYAYDVNPLAGFVPTPNSGNFTVAGGDTNVSIGWSVRLFTIDFVAHALPDSTPWSVTVGGVLYPSAASAIVVAESAGVYAYSVGEVSGYRADPSIGSVDLTGENETVNITWGWFTYAVDFIEQGLPNGVNWSLSVDAGDVWLNSSGPANIDPVPLPNGSFSYTVGAPAGFVGPLGEGKGTVQAHAFDVNVPFTPADGYLVGTIEPSTGSLTVDNLTVPLSDGSFNVSLTPGAHYVSASAGGYSTRAQEVDISAGVATPLAWQLDPIPTASSMPVPTPVFLGLWVTAVVVGAGVSVLVRRRRRGKTPPVDDPNEPEPAPATDEPGAAGRLPD